MARKLIAHTALAPDKLLVKNGIVREELGRMSSIEVELLSLDDNIDLDSLLGRSFSLELVLTGGQSRFFHGLVAECSQTGRLGRYSSYAARVVPWLWLLTRTSDCKIFQQQSVPDIIKSVFREHGTSDFEVSLSGNYSPRDYCVQYMETDFNFVSRLMEEEGIYYFFRHEQDKDTLVLCDSAGAHSATPGYESVPYYPADKVGRGGDYVNNWLLSHSMQSGKLSHTDFDFTKPRTSLLAQYATSRDYPKSDTELFEYPGGFVSVSDGSRYAQRRLESIQHQFERVSGSGDLASLAVGALFSLESYPRDDQNREYLVVSAVHHLVGEEFESGVSHGADAVTAQFEAIPSQQPYRTPLTTWKSRVPGPQTAIVVGKGGDEITVDQYGRVKVQFHWDRYGKRDENSSCWVRVSQAWAGKNWGAMHIPRIGQEVIVSFLEGDPDRPIITGRVYNAAEMPPYDLPANQTQSGIKSRSSKGGSPANFNEIRFEDKMGSELLTIHAEKDQEISVEHDENHTVGHDRTKGIGHDETTTVGNNRTETVGNNEQITIGVNRTENVGANETIVIGANRSISVGASETATVALQRTHTVGINETISVGAAQQINVGAAQTITVGAIQAVTVGANQTINVGANRSVTASSNQSVAVGSAASMTIGADESRAVTGGRTTSIGKDDALSITNNLSITAGDSITITTGSASITMKKDGTITISGKGITINDSGDTSIKSSGNITMKGSKIMQN